MIQIHGEGPFTINYVNPADDPRNKSSEEVGRGVMYPALAPANVMVGFVPAIHVFLHAIQDVHARTKCGHDSRRPDEISSDNCQPARPWVRRLASSLTPPARRAPCPSLRSVAPPDAPQCAPRNR